MILVARKNPYEWLLWNGSFSEYKTYRISDNMNRLFLLNQSEQLLN